MPWHDSCDSGRAEACATSERARDREPVSDRTLGWLVGMHLTFVFSGALLGLMDWIANKTKHERPSLP